MNQKGQLQFLPLILSALIPVLAVIIGIPLLAVFFGGFLTGLLKFLAIAGIGLVLFVLPGYFHLPKFLDKPLALGGLAFLFVGLATFMGVFPQSVFMQGDTIQSDAWSDMGSAGGLTLFCAGNSQSVSDTFTAPVTGRVTQIKGVAQYNQTGTIAVVLKDSATKTNVFSSSNLFPGLTGAPSGPGYIKVVWDLLGRADPELGDNELQVPAPAAVYVCMGRQYSLSLASQDRPVCFVNPGNVLQWRMFVLPSAEADAACASGTPPVMQPPVPLPSPGSPSVPGPAPILQPPAPVPIVNPSNPALWPLLAMLAVGGVAAGFMLRKY